MREIADRPIVQSRDNMGMLPKPFKVRCYCDQRQIKTYRLRTWALQWVRGVFVAVIDDQQRCRKRYIRSC